MDAGVRLSDSPFVEMIWHTHSEREGVFTSRAEYHWEMVITRFNGRTTFTLRGPETKATTASYPANFESFGIVFKPGVYMPHLPVRRLLDRNDLTLPEATNQSFWLLGSAWQMPTYENADTFVNRLVRDDLLARDPVIDAVLCGQQPDMSPRAIQYRFVNVTGLAHKTMQQIERAQRALALLQQGMPVLDTAYETGYFDQAHMTRSFKRFIGQTPGHILKTKPGDWL